MTEMLPLSKRVLVMLRAAEDLVGKGRDVEGVRLYRAALQLDPHSVEAQQGLSRHLLRAGFPEEVVGLLEVRADVEAHPALLVTLGVAQGRLGRFDRAIEAFDRALEIDPGLIEGRLNLGRALRAVGDLPGAVLAFEHATQVRPELAIAWSMLSNALREQERAEEALDAARCALTRDPLLVEAHLNEGASLHVLGRIVEALPSYFIAAWLDPAREAPRRNLDVAFKATKTSPQLSSQANDCAVLIEQALACSEPNGAAELRWRIGERLAAAGRWASAHCLWSRSLPRPSPPEAHARLAEASLALGLAGLALEHAKAAVERSETYAEGYHQWGLALYVLRDASGAEVQLRRAVELSSGDTRYWNSLGVALLACQKPVAATECLRRVLNVRPNAGATWSNLATALSCQGEHRQALQAYRRALKADPEDLRVRSNFIFALHYEPSVDSSELQRELRSYVDVVARARASSSPVAGSGIETPIGVNRRLRIGYVSPDLRRHPVVHFLEPVLRNHDASAFEVHVYSDALQPDEVTQRIRRSSPHFHETQGLSHPQFARRVQGHGIDILVDLAGHTAQNRLPAFDLRLAPVQVSWIGYFGTTGLSTVHYRIADGLSIPPGSEGEYSEEIWRLSRTSNVYLPDADSPAVALPPYERHGHATFGCFNNPAKLNREVVAAWARILGAVPKSHLLLKYATFGEQAMVDRYRAWFTEEGVSPDRIEFRGHSSMHDFLASFADVDIALDPFPYSGETTALHTLWMGVPLVALEGETLVQRLATRVLRIAGLPEWVARSKEEYVEIAVRAAQDLPALAALRRTIRPKLQASPLMDYDGFTRELEAAYREMWRRWCEGEVST